MIQINIWVNGETCTTHKLNLGKLSSKLNSEKVKALINTVIKKREDFKTSSACLFNKARFLFPLLLPIKIDISFTKKKCDFFVEGFR